MVFLSGCGRENTVTIQTAGQEHSFQTAPCKKENGEPFTIAFMDQGPPIESSYLCLKGLAEGLQNHGYIREDVPLTAFPAEFFSYYDRLRRSELGEYVRFYELPFMVDEGENPDVAEVLRKKTEQGEIDAVVATGTLPGVFLKKLDLPVPVLVCLATDPVASGIIASSETSGDPDIWALVEPNPYKRQFEGYQRMLGFQDLTMVSVNGMDTITGNPLYRDAAAELGIRLHEINFEAEDMEAEDYGERIAERLRSTDLTRTDAVLFAYGTMDDDNAPMLSGLVAVCGVPSLVGDGDSICERGAMMCLSCFDYEAYGNYAAMVLSNVFHGENAGDQPCVYVSSPHVVINLRTAKKTGFPLSFAWLQGVDRVYR